MAYTVGDVVILNINFRNRATKALVDPTAWEVRVKPPNAAKVTLVFGVAPQLSAIPSTTGMFQYRQPTDATNDDDAGRWEGWVVSTGTGQASRPFHFPVDVSPIRP